MATRYSNQDRDRIVAATDLVALIGEHIQLRPKGREHVGLCPFHDDSRPSMAVYQKADGQFYKCFACGAGGNAISFMIEFHKMSFPEALRELAQRASIELSVTHDDTQTGTRTSDLRKATEAASIWYQRRLADEASGASARAILTERGISEEMIQDFMLGYAPDEWDALCSRVSMLEQHARSGEKQAIPFDAFLETGLIRARKDGSGHFDNFKNRLIFPICNEMGRPIAFGARKINPEDEPKYLNSPESPLFAKSSTLYALNLARKAIIDEKHAIVVEGYTDAIACHQAGVRNVVATLGTAFTREHARRLERLCNRVTLLFDGDAAGQRAADKAVEVFFQSEIDLGICTLPGGADPDDLLRTPEGLTAFHDAVNSAKDSLEHLTSMFRRAYSDASGVSERQNVISGMLDRLANLGFANMDGIRKHLVLDELSKTTGIPEAELNRGLIARGPRKRPTDDTSSHEQVDTEYPNDDVEQFEAPTIEVSRRRHIAERCLLALLVKDPELGRLSVPAGEGTHLPVSELFPASQFKVPEHHALAETLIPLIEAGKALQIDKLINSVEHATAILVTDLFRFGSDLLENTDKTPSDLLETLCADLEKTDRHEYTLASSEDPASNPATGKELDEQLVKIRSRGSDMTLIPRVQRPRRPQPASSLPSHRKSRSS